MWHRTVVAVAFVVLTPSLHAMASGRGLASADRLTLAVAAKKKPKLAPAVTATPIDPVAKAEFDASLAKANAGDTAAMQSLVYNFKQGYGVAKDPAAAAFWENRRVASLKDAAERGDTDAMSELVTLYDVGADGVAVDAVKARHWNERRRDAMLARAQTGDGASMFALAEMLEWAAVGHSDYDGAVVWMRKAAEAGHFSAMARLAEKYDEGRDVPADRVEAFKWYLGASNDPKDPWSARIALANKYKTGDGVAKNVVEAARLHVMIAETYGGWRRKMRAEGFAEDVARGEVGYRRAVQRELAERGLFKGAIDGQPGASLDDAVKAVWRRKANP